MSKPFFDGLAPVRFEGSESDNPLAYRHYNPDELVLGKRMEEHLRFAVCYWHTFCWQGNDPFGAPTLDRPWFAANDMAHAKQKADAAFDLFDLLGVPFFCFHDRDAAPEGDTLAQSERNLNDIADYFERKMQTSKTRLLWGTANLFSHPRYLHGAATSPDLAVFRHACAQVKAAMEVTHRLGGANYVLWGGREGYDTLLNTDLKQELEQYGRFLSLVVEHKHKIGFAGTILVEPKPQEPTKHQYDFDVSTVYGMLKRFGLEHEVKLNIEVGHAVLAGHSFEHEIATAIALGIFGSCDANRNDYQCGWDTDHFPNNAEEMTLALYHILRAGGFTTGGLNFDAKLRRGSIAKQDLLHGHIGAFDTCAYALKAAARMLTQGKRERFLEQRYASWQTPAGQATLKGHQTLADLAQAAHQTTPQEPSPTSGAQEYLENLVHRYTLR